MAGWCTNQPEGVWQVAEDENLPNFGATKETNKNCLEDGKLELHNQKDELND